MLVECGFVRATASDGSEWTFRPSLARIAALGTPEQIVATFAALHGPRAAPEAAFILSVLCDQDDPSPLIGWHEEVPVADGRRVLRWRDGMMPAGEQVLIARHLMLHGIVGKASPGRGGGEYSQRFDASEYVAAARVHLGLSSADAEALSMTEFQTMLEMKFPSDEPAELTLEEFEEALEAERLREQERGHV